MRRIGKFIGNVKKVKWYWVAVTLLVVFMSLYYMCVLSPPAGKETAPADCYWVGGSGSWADDDNHWATVSGGAPANGNLPDQTSNVHFDALSGFLPGDSTVAIGASDVLCNDMDWTGAPNSPILSGTGGVDLYGTLTLISTVSFVSTPE